MPKAPQRTVTISERPEDHVATQADVQRLEGKVEGLETLLRALTVALRSGAVGKWA